MRILPDLPDPESESGSEHRASGEKREYRNLPDARLAKISSCNGLPPVVL